MNYHEIGERIRKIRTDELNKTREEFAEELGISTNTASRLENANNEVRNVEIFLKISEMSGYTMEELLLGNNKTVKRGKIKKRINYLLNILSEDELDYVFNLINNFVKFNHKKQLVTLKDIKNKIKNKRD